jgi:hypothetical protein
MKHCISEWLSNVCRSTHLSFFYSDVSHDADWMVTTSQLSNAPAVWSGEHLKSTSVLVWSEPLPSSVRKQ